VRTQSAPPANQHNSNPREAPQALRSQGKRRLE
jgi:hypothetical protein